VAVRLLAPGTHVVTITVTEKGYCRAPDGSLDLELARGNTIYRHLAGALGERRRAGIAGMTLLSCDNLAGNGDQLRRLMEEYLAAEDPVTRDWFRAQCTCPNAMVDRIVPATTEADLAAIQATLGMRDEGAVITERFSQWVIEDRFAGPRPDWDKAGAQLVDDVAPYETAKLRMLNGAHSALAYCGLGRGHEFVHQAIADPPLRALVERLMRQEAASSFMPDAGQDLEAYADALLARFADPALNHRLTQIAMDGSQKIPQRWLETLAFHRQHGAACPALVEALAAWIGHVRGDLRPVDDPLAERLAGLWASAGTSGIAAALFGENGLFARYWQADEETLAALTEKLG
jgi:fructuronate reductase